MVDSREPKKIKDTPTIELQFEYRNLHENDPSSPRHTEIEAELKNRMLESQKIITDKERVDRYIHANPDVMKRNIRTMELPLYDKNYALLKTVVITDQWTPADFRKLSSQYPNTYIYTSAGTKPVYLLGEAWNGTDFNSLERYYNSLNRKQAASSRPSNIHITPKMPRLG